METQFFLSAMIAFAALFGLQAHPQQQSTEIPLVGNIYGRQEGVEISVSIPELKIAQKVVTDADGRALPDVQDLYNRKGLISENAINTMR